VQYLLYWVSAANVPARLDSQGFELFSMTRDIALVGFPYAFRCAGFVVRRSRRTVAVLREPVVVLWMWRPAAMLGLYEEQLDPTAESLRQLSGVGDD
jgi:hypothetical protein